jgi:omega-6 fatty acid desaturase (delta-12 desaturase)
MLYIYFSGHVHREYKNSVSIPSQSTANTSSKAKDLPWRQAVAGFQQSDWHISVWQLINSIGPYFILWYLAFRSLGVSYWLTLLFAVGAALFVLRIFIIFHDAGHGSFFKSRKVNDITGIITGILTFTPYYAWRHSHAIHHATAGDLDHRGVGDVWTLTYDEYHALPLWQRALYRVYRNPFVIFVIGPTIDFVVLQRIPRMSAAAKRREKNSIHVTNLALLTIAAVMSLLIGLKAYILVQLPIIAVASSLGVWLFYVQHQYENVYWERHENWDFATAALFGSSFYKLPKLLQWFTGNIGFHHIHHLSPRIPNYKLETCHEQNPVFQQVEPLTLRTSLKSLRIRLWDEDRHRVIGYHKPLVTE